MNLAPRREDKNDAAPSAPRRVFVAADGGLDPASLDADISDTPQPFVVPHSQVNCDQSPFPSLDGRIPRPPHVAPNPAQASADAGEGRAGAEGEFGGGGDGVT